MTDRTQRIFTCQGHLISEVVFFLDEQGWVVGYMRGYNDGVSLLSVTPEEAVAAHRSRALVPVPGGSDYGLLTVALVEQYRLWAEGWLDGARWAREVGRSHAPGYADLRDALLGFVDLPEELAGLIALWLTRDPATQFWLSFTVVL
jgi:hypothetical protein